MQERSRSQSPVRQRPLSDEEYVKIVKHHNSSFSRPSMKIDKLYIVVQMPKKNLFGECLTVKFTRSPSKLLWVALYCLTTAQRDSQLRNQPQTKRIAELIFRKPTIENAKWFESLFPGEEWQQTVWYDQFASANDMVDGFLWNAPILESLFDDE
jgi:hypothetical protein